MKQLFGFCLLIGILSGISASCSKDDEPSGNKEIVGKWQKYARVEDDGSLSGGDPDEFWIFNADGSFVNEDSGSITTTGTYQVKGDKLTILSREIGSPKEENFTGTFKIDGKFMDYTFTENGDDDITTYRFLKQ